MADIATPKETQAILKQFDLHAKKSLGQNFIIDTNILNKIVEAGPVDEQTVIIEVGPGVGALTEQLAKVAQQVYAFEIDERMLEVLDQSLSPYPNVKVFHQDILEVDLRAFSQEYLKEAERVVVVANLPYYITTPIIMKFLHTSNHVDAMVFMMQKEVAQRMAAQEGSKEYGSLSLAIQYYAQSKLLFTVPKTVFMPQPRVDSAVVRLQLKDQLNPKAQDEEFLFNLIRGAFSQRRKTLWNNLRHFFYKNAEVLEKVQVLLGQVGIDGQRRGETLSLEEYVKLANLMVDQDLHLTPHLGSD